MEGAPHESTPGKIEISPEYRVAATLEERQAAHTLSDRVYEREELKPQKEDQDEDHYPFEKWIMSPATRVFTASIEGELVATIAVVKDSEIGLPMDELYKEELQTYRDQGDRLCEVSQYAVDADRVEQDIREGKISARNLPGPHLLEVVLQYVLRESIDRLFIVCRPTHANFYRSMGLIPIGEEKYYSKVNNVAVPLMLDVRTLTGEGKESLPRRMRALLGANIPDDLLA